MLDLNSQRRLTLDLGNGNCKWQPPSYNVSEEIDFHKTLVAGYPSGDKRMIFVQMEALTGLREFGWEFDLVPVASLTQTTNILLLPLEQLPRTSGISSISASQTTPSSKPTTLTTRESGDGGTKPTRWS